MVPKIALYVLLVLCEMPKRETKNRCIVTARQ